MRLLPRHRVEPDEFAVLCEARAWMFHDRAEDPGSGAARYTWITPDGAVLVTYVYDPTLELSYVVTQESGFAEGGSLESVTDDLRSAVNALEPEAALALFHESAGDPAGEIAALHLIAASAPEAFDSAFFEGFVPMLHSENEDVRCMALVATLYMPWEPILPAIEALAAADDSERVRSLAHAVRSDHPLSSGAGGHSPTQRP